MGNLKIEYEHKQLNLIDLTLITKLKGVKKKEEEKKNNWTQYFDIITTDWRQKELEINSKLLLVELFSLVVCVENSETTSFVFRTEKINNYLIVSMIVGSLLVGKGVTPSKEYK